jgi:hypothetical protein
MANSFLPFLLPFSRDDVRHGVRRIKARVKRAWHEAVIPLGLAAALATLAALSLRILLARQDSAQREDQHLFTQTFGVEQEQRELPYPGVVAGLLGTINSSYEELHCADGAALTACRRKEALLDSATRLFALAVDPEVSLGADTVPPDGCGSELAPEVRSELAELWAGDPADEVRRCAWFAAASDTLRMIRAGAAQVFHSCPTPEDGKSTVHGIGEPACQMRGPTDQAATLLSAQTERHYVQQRLMSHLEGTTAEIPVDWDSDAKEAAGVARLLDISIMNAEAVVASDSAASSGSAGSANGAKERALLDDAELRQAYFISPDNLLRIWALAGNPLMDLPRARLWTAAAYLRPFVDKGARFAVKTRAYLDVGGNGVVTTECRPLWLDNGKDSDFIGAVCTDLTLNIFKNVKLREKLVSNRFLHIEPVTITARDNARKVTPITSDRGIWHHDEKKLRDAIFAEVDKFGLTPLSQSVRPIVVDEVSAFIVPIGKINEYEIQALIVSPERPTINHKLLRWTVLLVIGIVGYLVFTGMLWFKKRREEDVRNHLVIFRSAQTGIIETLADGEQIVRANDRAEEILGVCLPKSSNPHDPASISFTDIYDLALEVVDDPWPDARDGGEAPPAPPGDTTQKKQVNYRVLSPEDIFMRRFEGRTTRHWIHLTNVDIDDKDEKLAKSWVSIQGGPLVSQTGNYFTWLLRSSLSKVVQFDLNKSVGAFGTVDRASRRRAAELDEFRQKHLQREAKKAAKAKKSAARTDSPDSERPPDDDGQPVQKPSTNPR